MPKRSSVASLSDVLRKRKVLNPADLKAAEEEAKAASMSVENYLVEKELVPSDTMALAVSEYLDIPPISLAHFTPDTQLLEIIPRNLLEKHRVLPIARSGKDLTIAMADAFNIVAVEELQTFTGLNITPLVTPEDHIQDALRRSMAEEADSLDMDEIMKEAEGDVDFGGGVQEDADIQSLENMKESAEEGPVIRMVNMILVESVRLNANDIHIEPQEDFVRLRYRVDGVLVERPNLPKSLQSAITSRVRIMADLDIGENRIPQDGRFRIKTMGKTIDVRVSILPTIFGGRVVMRTLDKSALFPSIAALGLDKTAYDAMSYAVAQPHGIILVTGPTGSGKTTTLYSCLQELNKTNVNVVTCEDPVEYQIPGIIQVRINADVGCTFAAALRAILRQDPDIVLIGEIRDTETCEIAIKAALTGHLVLTTLHANDAAATITRLLDMGMEPFLLASSIILTQAQRLYRKLCPACKKETKLDKDLLTEYEVDPNFFEGVKVYGPVGCPKCHNLGYRGRGAIMEVLPIDDDIRQAIVQQMIADQIRELAIEKGMVGLKQAGMTRVKEGDTSLEAVLKETGSGE